MHNSPSEIPVFVQDGANWVHYGEVHKINDAYPLTDEINKLLLENFPKVKFEKKADPGDDGQVVALRLTPVP